MAPRVAPPRGSRAPPRRPGPAGAHGQVRGRVPRNRALSKPRSFETALFRNRALSKPRSLEGVARREERCPTETTVESGGTSRERLQGYRVTEENRALSKPRSPPPFLPRTNRISLVPPLVLSGHAASLTPYLAPTGRTRPNREHAARTTGMRATADMTCARAGTHLGREPVDREDEVVFQQPRFLPGRANERRRADADHACRGTRRVRLVRGEGRGVST